MQLPKAYKHICYVMEHHFYKPEFTKYNDIMHVIPAPVTLVTDEFRSTVHSCTYKSLVILVVMVSDAALFDVA